ncbi:MAG TPA: beta-ketoacyl-ACP synthase II [Vicinamibacteria bacterium]|nr:beta-ketoacyl-ACP synthase II [Vicinamibacteria bacterium]
MRRVVVTGLGVVSPLGLGAEPTWEGLLAGRSGAGPITLFDCSRHTTKFACEVKNFDPHVFSDKKEARKMDRFIQLGVAATEYAIKDSNLTFTREESERVGVFIGSGIGGFATIEREHAEMLSGGPRRISPFFIPSAIINLAAGWVTIRTGARGPSSATATACTSSAHSIGDAFRVIQRGEADVMIAGGSEAAITGLGVGGFNAMRALSTRNDAPEKASRPFDKDRDGFVIGEGSGILILEELERAKARGAKIYCELVGYAMTSDAHHITAPCEDGDGAARVMAKAIKDAGIRPDQVAYVNAHGTSTPVGDQIEVIALKTVFGEHAKKLVVGSTKSMTGHLLGAAGGLEASITALAIRDQKVPPTINIESQDPECDIDAAREGARSLAIEYALSNSFGFGGTNGALVFKRYAA